MIHGSMNWESINQHQAGFNEVRLQVFDTAHLGISKFECYTLLGRHGVKT